MHGQDLSKNASFAFFTLTASRNGPRNIIPGVGGGVGPVLYDMARQKFGVFCGELLLSIFMVAFLLGMDMTVGRKGR